MNEKTLNKRILEWIQPGIVSEGWILLLDGEEYGRFGFENWSHKYAEGKTAFGHWQFAREGFWKQRFIIYRKDTGKEIAIFRKKWSASQGTVQFIDGKRFHWDSRKIWNREYSLTDEADNLIFTLKKGLEDFKLSGIFKQQGTIQIEKIIEDEELFSVLLLLAWFLILMEADEQAASAAVMM